MVPNFHLIASRFFLILLRSSLLQFLGTFLAWDESTRTDFSKSKSNPKDGASVSTNVADRLKMKIDELLNFVKGNRVLRWEDQISRLLDERKLTAAAVKKALPRNHRLNEYLSQRESAKKSNAPVH